MNIKEEQLKLEYVQEKVRSNSHMANLLRINNTFLNIISVHEKAIEKYMGDNETVDQCIKTIETLKALSDVKTQAIEELLKIAIDVEDHMPAWCREIKKHTSTGQKERKERKGTSGGYGTKDVTCQDCGTVFALSIRGRQTEKCKDCRKQYHREMMRKRTSINYKEEKRLQELDNQTQ